MKAIKLLSGTELHQFLLDLQTMGNKVEHNLDDKQASDLLSGALGLAPAATSEDAPVVKDAFDDMLTAAIGDPFSVLGEKVFADPKTETTEVTSDKWGGVVPNEDHGLAGLKPMKMEVSAETFDKLKKIMQEHSEGIVKVTSAPAIDPAQWAVVDIGQPTDKHEKFSLAQALGDLEGVSQSLQLKPKKKPSLAVAHFPPPEPAQLTEPATTVIQDQAVATQTIKNPDGTTSVGTELVGTPKLFAAPPCHVEVGCGSTHNLGNFNSAKFEVKLTVPCAHAEIDQVYDFAYKWVDKRMSDIAETVAKGTT